MKERGTPSTDAQAADPRSRWLRKSGGSSALVAGILLLIGMISLGGWLSPFRDNWLIVIFKLHAGLGGAEVDLQGLNLLDIVVLALVSIICLSLSTAFRKAGRTWSLVAFALSLVAIVLYIATQSAGRSTVMLAVLILSLVMLRNKTFRQRIVYAGIPASVFLFAGDLTVGIHSAIITILFGVGYVLLIAWFFLVAQALFRPEPEVLTDHAQ